MSDARERILGSIRTALRRDGPLTASVAEALEDRTRAARPNQPRPAFDASDLPARFAAKLEAAAGKVSRVTTVAEVSAVVSAHLAEHDLGDAVVMAPDPALDDIPWSNALAIERRAARGTDRVSVTACFAGIAETGSVVLLSGPESPTTLNFLPDDHLVVLRAPRIVPYLEDAWRAIREQCGAMPRAVNFIGGPSKTADVEQTLQLGAHGPRRLHVILVDG